MQIPSKYNPGETEDKWHNYWLEKKFFHSEPDDRAPYTIVIPPPNVTGVLHMGHMLNNTIQDILVRKARMQGFNAVWVPGTDHASIATEAKVVNKLRSEGIDKNELSREEFLEHAWDWREKHGGIILEQLKKLGASCDWDRTKFTMDDDMYESVIDVFINLYNKGKIYRGVRMVNWDPKALTALSDEEVIYREVNSKLYYVRYPVEGSEDEFVNIATTRPETILGDTAVCVNPKDPRYKHLKGKRVLVPLVNRPVPVIEDDYVDMEFGTGCLKITPAHDENDYNIGIKYNLKTIDIFNDDGTLNEKAEVFIGEDRFVAREKAAKELQESGHMIKVEDYVNKVGYSERTDAAIEPKLSRQWFCKMEELSKPALELVMEDKIKFHPAKFKNSYRHWMENIRDWCISRQLWWGQRIPAYYTREGEVIVAKTKKEALEKAHKEMKQTGLKPEDLQQDEDVLDTWFSSWLWPISVFDGIRDSNNKDISYYYPTNDLVTAPEILFFWVARMIMAGWEYRKEIPFKNVYFTGIVRDKQGRKMSKQLGNSPDPIRLMSEYGADGVRLGMLLTSPAGNDLPFDENLCEQGRNFSNKIWNALRLVKGWKIDETLQAPTSSTISNEWFENCLGKAIETIEKQFSQYRLSEALMTVYRLIWDDFCSWYLEMIKPVYQQPIDKVAYNKTIYFFEQLMKILHPFMPFVTEEIWYMLQERGENDSITIAEWPQKLDYDTELLKRFEFAREVIIGIRSTRSQQNIPNKEAIRLSVKKNNQQSPDAKFDPVVEKLGNLSGINYLDEPVEGATSFIIQSTEFYIPFSQSLDVEAELKKLQEDLEYTKGFLNSVMKKLSNERFVQNAPGKVVENERKKKADADAKIKVIEEKMESLKKA